jgi:hypothetical protein
LQISNVTSENNVVLFILNQSVQWIRLKMWTFMFDLRAIGLCYAYIVYRCTYVRENKTGENDIHLRLKSTYLRFYLFVCRDISQYLIKLVGWFYCV